MGGMVDASVAAYKTTIVPDFGGIMLVINGLVIENIIPFVSVDTIDRTGAVVIAKIPQCLLLLMESLNATAPVTGAVVFRRYIY